MIALPIDQILPQLIDALRCEPSVVLRAPAGAGKTTRVPPALIDSGLSGESQILVLQPRRVAARAVARRMAEERGGRIGDEIGYHIRFDRRIGRQTRIIVMTEGVLVRRLQEDPFLEGIAAVVFDEFHERHFDTDVSLAMCHRVQQTVRPDLKLLVMSATLDAAPIAKYLGGCSVVECEVPRFPIEIRYQPVSTTMPLAVQAAQEVSRLWDETAGDMLVFLPGVREIRRAQDELSRLAAIQQATILPLYGELSADEQDRVFKPCATRKIVLATNVAETSITIPGITTVVDTGIARVLEFDAATGLNRLELQSISKASADQRAGRAGRTGPGLCVRLWAEASHRHRPDRETAEIHRIDLSSVVLQLRAWGEDDVTQFPWYERPAQDALNQASRLLCQLGAFSPHGLTELGRQMSQLPIAPRLARLLIEGTQSGQLRRAALLVALISERDPFERREGFRVARHCSQSDLIDRVDALDEFARSHRTQFEVGSLNRAAADFVLRAAGQLEREISIQPTITDADTDDALLRAILVAYPDRLARRREPKSCRAVMVGGRGVRLADQSAVTDGELFVCVDLDAGGQEAIVRQASYVDRKWLPEELLTTNIDFEFDPTEERVQARRRVRWDDLVLEESPTPLADHEQTAMVLAREARSAWSRVFPSDNPELVSLLARIHSLSEWMPELNLPRYDDEQLQRLLPTLCSGRRSFAELRQAPWVDALRSSLPANLIQILDREAPERVQVPSGSRVAIQYEQGRPPILAVRIQEVFGWRSSPRIAGGRIPLLLHLLAPNHRPQQITDDLESFWKNGYPVVRSELRRRYPKHAWPEDPWTATAERRPQRK